MKPFTESARYEYDLKPTDVVVDIGAHKGTFAREIHQRYGCQVIAFEPLGEFYREACTANIGNIRFFNVGVAAFQRMASMAVRGDSSGEFADGDKQEVGMADVSWIFDEFGDVALMKLNCEGGEYEILEAMIKRGLHLRTRNIQVQFHACAPDYETRMITIQCNLAKSHHLTYEAPMCWENWEIST